MSRKITFFKLYGNKGPRLLPFQYYDTFNMITIPTNGKVPFIRYWDRVKKTVPPIYIENNIAMLTGSINDITVLDIDLKESGLEHWESMLKEHGIKRLDTPTVKTASGFHIYFKYEKDLKTSNRITVIDPKTGLKKRIGWDLRNDKAMVLVPPSIINDVKYVFVIPFNKDKIMKMPEWLKIYIMEHASPYKKW